MEEESTTTMFDKTSEIEEILDSVDLKFNSFKNFDITSVPPIDHHFILNSRPPLDRQFMYSSRRVVKEHVQLMRRIKQERDVLENNLSKSIFVRSYETRLDLMRAVIVGLPSSPYAYSLFIFDIYFPKDYPSKPPQIFQHHNPNLLDWKPTLLSNNNNKSVGSGLWWDPETSNICHILEYIQGSELRFTKIYDKQDEKDFMLTHKTMLSILRSPPKGFEDFVKGYFRKYSHAISMNLKLKGNLSESQMNTDLFFEMIQAFEGNGSYCKHLVYKVERVVSQESQASSSQPKMIKGEASSMGVLFKRALSKTNGLIMHWLHDDDTDGRLG
ncbi:probable ubiquitin-conjugating enzyme E2 23 [Chenopodium quinoa]|uniref:probable ubiquitin-conjugating enzyme E2 23 n=1 Tax=Chenopodium quinoa TaxID=63459 RepID=UPI000B789123|nr:probable ubiquitin-conjugating enzyme E2 23 [Chenopodium quinoa]